MHLILKNAGTTIINNAYKVPGTYITLTTETMIAEVNANAIIQFGAFNQNRIGSTMSHMYLTIFKLK